MKHMKKILAWMLVLCMFFSLAPTAFAAEQDGMSTPTSDAISEEGEPSVQAEKSRDSAVDVLDEEKSTENAEVFYRIFHLDCGRKYFSVSQIKAIIDKLAENGYTHLELAIGNDGLRFLLDDMSVAANDTTYASENVKAGIQAGNRAYYNDSTNELTETEMDTIIEYADTKGISIIPLLNTPGHMDAILDCMESVGISSPAYGSSARTVDVTNETAVNFTLALVNKYIKYFAGKGCKIFNMGCDEYANDRYGSGEMGFGHLISNNKYDSFVTYVNNMAKQVKDVGMTPMAFNDGIYYRSRTDFGTFDTDIAVAYWTSGWGDYSPAPASFLAEKGHKIINTNDTWYYVLGRTSGSYTLSSAKNGVQSTACTDIPGNSDPVASGCMICLWCDTPSVSYNDTEVNNVTNLISTLAEKNPTYFTVSSGGTGNETDTPSGKTEEKTITLTVGETKTETIEGYDYSENVIKNELDEGIAVVSATHKQVEGKTEKALGNAVSMNSNGVYEGVIYDGNGNYLVLNGTTISSTTDINQATVFTVTRTTSGWNTNYTIYSNGYYLGYGTSSNIWDSTYTLRASTQKTEWSYRDGFYIRNFGTNYYLRTNNGTWEFASTNSRNGQLYSVTTNTTEPVNNTEVTFTGKKAGTTYVTVGNIKYTINVIAEDLSGVAPLTVEYWITNNEVYTAANASSARSIDISAQDAYGEAGVDISRLVPEMAYSNYDNWLEVHFWQAMRLDSSNHQTHLGDDKTASGTGFTKIRYYDGFWQYFSSDDAWHSFGTGDQVVAYYMRYTEITKEITTGVKDWGYGTDGTTPDTSERKSGQVALTVAVVYPDMTVSPTESNMYAQSTVIYNYWSGRDIGIVAPLNNSDYEISKITVTDGTRTDSTTATVWYSDSTIEWEKTTNAAGQEWYDETEVWNDTMETEPVVNGKTSNITWSAKNTAKLVLIYLKPVHHDSNLTVVWYDDTGKETIKSQEIVVDYTGATPVTFLNGLNNNGKAVQAGEITLDDAAYITNKAGVNQTFNKDLTVMSDIAGKYTSGLYNYSSADISEDGKTLTLHYTLKNMTYNLVYVVDYGLPVTFSLSDLISEISSVKNVTVTSNASYDSTSKNITYTPSAVLTSIEPVTVRITYQDDSIVTLNVGMVPASTVYYEEGFASYTGEWSGNASKGTGVQTTEKIIYSEGKYITSKVNNYGYDPKYAAEAAGASNGTQAVSSTKGDKAVFTFTGTGVDLYVNSTETSGNIAVQVRDASNKLVKVLSIQTTSNSTITGEFRNTEQYGLIAASVRGLAYGNYTIKITTTSDATVYFDGFRIYGTIQDQKNDYYLADQEDDPVFLELRDYVLTAMGVENSDSEEVYAQVREKTDGQLTGVVLNNNSVSYDGKALLENGPKNELFLLPGQSVVFKLNTNREVQLGMKAVNGSAKVQVNSGDGIIYDNTVTTATDMFYTVAEASENVGEKTITVYNDEESTSILSITKVKICDDPSVVFAELVAEDLDGALVLVNGEEPAEPEVTYADAVLNIAVNDADGKQLAATTLTANGIVGESAVFAAADIQAAVETLELPEDYKLEETSYSDVTVGYGESSDAAFKAVEEKVIEPDLEPDPEPEQPTTIVEKIFTAIKNIFGKFFR